MCELKKLRLELKLSQAEMAEILDVPKSYISYYEKGILKPNKNYLNDIIKVCETKDDAEQIEEDYLKKKKSTSHYNNEMYSPVRTIEYYRFHFLFERTIINNKIMFSIKLLREKETQFEIFLSVSELTSFLERLYSLLENTFLYTVRACGGNIEISRLNNKENYCILCGEKIYSIVIKMQNKRIVVCEECAEKIYYQLDDLSFDYVNRKPF